MKLSVPAFLAIGILLLPPAALADTFQQNIQSAQSRVAAETDSQLSNLGTSVYTDAFVTARIIGYDPNEIDQMKADIQQLKDENAQLQTELAARPTVSAGSDASLEPRVAALEARMSGLQSTLASIVAMLTQVLGKLQ